MNFCLRVFRFPKIVYKLIRQSGSAILMPATKGNTFIVLRFGTDKGIAVISKSFDLGVFDIGCLSDHRLAVHSLLLIHI